MTGPAGRAGAFTCRIRYDSGGQPDLPAGEVERLSRFVAAKGWEWGVAICRFLGLDPVRSVTVTLRQGAALSMTRGSDVVVGVARGTVSAALAHELVHAVAGPSPRPAYSEGLAVWVDAALRLAGPAWPFFELDPDRWVRQFVEDGSFVSVADLLAGPTTAPSDEEGISAPARVYLEAASLIGHVLARSGLEVFWPHFHSGRPLAAPGADTAALERAWLASLGGPITEREARLRDASLARLVADGRHGVGARSSAPAGAGG